MPRFAKTAADLIEAQLFAGAAKQANKVNDGPIFIVGSPRTGSTIFYQALVAAFGLPYFANLTNKYFANHPILGLWLQARLSVFGRISGHSRFGKVKGTWQPAEASAIMTSWFGGGHPSEITSSRALSNREENLQKTIDASHRLFARPLVIKNAWNCFRIPYLRATLRGSTFIWIRRDLMASARSDLCARYLVQGDPHAWNSATPRNWDTLRERPYWEQVVENQAEFSRAIDQGLGGLPPEHRAEVWYEDFCADAKGTLARLANTLRALHGVPFAPARIPAIVRTSLQDALDAYDSERIEDYIAANAERLEYLRFSSCRSRCKARNPTTK